jgi:hypothetical protein
MVGLMKFQVMSCGIMDLQPLMVWRKVFYIFVSGVLVSYFIFVIGDEVQYFSAVVSLVVAFVSHGIVVSFSLMDRVVLCSFLALYMLRI